MQLKQFSKHDGSSLIEVLVSIAIVGIVVFGYMAVQLNAVFATNDAHFRVQALNIASEMAERMSINQDTAGAAKLIYRAESSYGATPTAQDCVSTAGVNGSNQSTVNCTPAEMATYDISSLSAKAAALLAGGQLRLFNCTDATDCVVVSWLEQDPADCTIAQADAANGALNCVLVEIFTGGSL